jgi:hypothetical protein
MVWANELRFGLKNLVIDAISGYVIEIKFAKLCLGSLGSIRSWLMYNSSYNSLVFSNN